MGAHTAAVHALEVFESTAKSLGYQVVSRERAAPPLRLVKQGSCNSVLFWLSCREIESKSGGTKVAELAKLRLSECLEILSSERPSLGCGAAAAIALALAAGCAAKAAAVSAKHETAQAMRNRQRELEALGRQALGAAQQETQRFVRFVQDRTAETLAPLISTESELEQICSEVLDRVAVLQSEVDESVSGDLVAARILCEAFLSIERHNRVENSRIAKPDRDGEAS
jgi:hypothetical protein